MSIQPPITKGIINAFDIFLGDLRKLLAVSSPERFRPQIDSISSPAVFESAQRLFLNITEDSTEDDCLECMKAIQDLTSQPEFELEKVTSLTNFYDDFRKLRNLIERKLCIPLEEWKQAKHDAMTFPELYGELVREFEDLRQAVEKARLLRDKMMPDQESEIEKLKKKRAASEDFKSLHPFFIISNSEEHMETISVLKEKKIQDLEEQAKDADEKFQRSTLKYKEEIQNIIEETIKTKSFIEWLEVQNHLKLKYYKEKMSEKWKEFSSEMEESRKLGKIYIEKHAIYLEIEREKAERERLGKQEAAATVIQAHWRGFIARKRLLLTNLGDFMF